jgi:uncharacterized protein
MALFGSHGLGIRMRDDRFEWDDGKAATNWKKHRVSFHLAREVFDDPNALEELDDDSNEERWQRTGLTTGGVLLVVYTERGPRNRIISARRATSHEQDRYIRQARPQGR